MKRALPVLLLLAPALADAAPRTPYGSELLVYVYGQPIVTTPAELAGPADATLQLALYERLYRIEDGKLVEQLASGPPVVEGRRVTVPLKTGVRLHDGRTLTAAMVAASLKRLVATDSRAAYVGAYVRGGPQTLAGKNPPLGIRAKGSSIVFDLNADHPDFPRVLASAHAAIVVAASGRAALLGTGPFMFGSRGARGEIELRPFLGHRRGRPFLDRIRFRPHASRFGAASIAKKQDGFVFGVPDTAERRPPKLLSWPSGETLALVVNPKTGGPELARAIDAALNRRRLASRFLGADAVPTDRLLDFNGPKTKTDPPKAANRSAALLVSKSSRASHRLADRIQLDLLRAGISVRIERIAASRLEARKRAGDYDLLLDTLTSGAPATKHPADRLHALLSIAASIYRLDAIDPTTLSLDRLDEAEAAVRTSLGIVPIARRRAAVAPAPDFDDTQIDPAGALRLADAHRSR